MLQILFAQGTNDASGPFVELRRWDNSGYQKDVVLRSQISIVTYDFEGYIASQDFILAPRSICLNPNAPDYELIRYAIEEYDKLQALWDERPTLKRPPIPDLDEDHDCCDEPFVPREDGLMQDCHCDCHDQ